MSLNKDFVTITENFKTYLSELKVTFDKFDKENKQNDKRISFVEFEKDKTFKKLDYYFGKSWEILGKLSAKDYSVYQKYYQKLLLPLIEDLAEVNRRIHRKPLGYPGDYVMMEYIYDYHDGAYLGESSYEMLINNYTCNIPFSKSNITRKDFFKNEIKSICNNIPGANILSVGAGSARELIELLLENSIDKDFNFHYLDFEQKAIDFVRNKLAEMDQPSKKSVNINFCKENVIDIIKNKDALKKLNNMDFIYASGIFDYLKDRMAATLFLNLFNVLKKDGKIIICNASKEHNSHRAYYETLGEWHMFYRISSEVKNIARHVSDLSKIDLLDNKGSGSYHFLSVQK